MNKIFKVVWSKVKHCYVVVSEVAKENSKSGVKSRVGRASLAATMAVTFMLSAGTAMAAEYNDQDYTSDNGTNVITIEQGQELIVEDTNGNETKINGVLVSNAAGLDREATSRYYQSTTIEGKTKIDSMGRVYTNHVFADQAIIVGDHSTLDRTGLYVGENFKVERETGNVTVGTINGAEISEYKVNGVVLDKDGDVFAKDIMATGGITALGNLAANGQIIANDGMKIRTGGEGSFSFGNIEGNSLFYAMSTDSSKINPTIVMNAQNGNIETQGSLDVGNGAFISDATSGNAAVKGSLVVGGDVAVEGGLNVGTDVVANGVSLNETAQQVAANKDAIAANKEAIALNDRVNQVQNKQIAQLQSKDLELESAIEANKQAIAKETADRVAADEALQSQVDTNKADIATNAAGIRQNADAIAGLDQNITRLDGRLDKVGAGAAALAALHPLDYDSENKLSFSAGVGNYAGSTAAAIGAFYRPNEDVMLNIGGTAGNGENMVNMGVSFAIGKGSSGIAKMSKAELVQEVTNMKVENEELKQENKDIRDELNKLRELVMKLAEEK